MSEIKKIPKAVETDELLKLLEEDKVIVKEHEVIYKNDILEFLTVFKIEPGEDKIKKYTLYSIYKVWSKEPLSKKEFYKQVAPFLPVCNIAGVSAYFINNNAIKLTHAAYSYFKKDNSRLKSKFWAKHFENFLDFHALKSGNYYIEESVLFFIYKKYITDLKLDINMGYYLSENNFYNYCKIFLKHKITKNGKLYAVSDNIINHFNDGQLKKKEVKSAKKNKKKSTETP